MKTPPFFLLIFFSFLMMAGPSQAAQISKVNNTQAIVNLQGESTSAGAEFYALNSAGKKVAILQVKQVKGDRALMMIKKGKASVGQTLQTKAASAATANSSATASGDPTEEDMPTVKSSSIRKKTKLKGGVLVGYAMSTMTMSVQVGTERDDIKMTDSSFGVKAFVDYSLSPSINIRGATGYETFAAKGTIPRPNCLGGTPNCQANYNYLPIEGSAHYNFMTGNTRAWAGLGYSFLIELSRNVNIPNLNSENKTNQMILFGLGADFRSGKTNFIPVVLEYAMFPGSTNVSANAIYLRTGYGFVF